MSGETSKSSGEFGERLAESFLKEIGWDQGITSLSIPCTSSAHKNAGGKQRESHGDDRVFIYNNPFYEDRTDIVHVSVKNNIGGYAKEESKLRRSLKGFVEEANQIIECAQHDDRLINILRNFKGKKRREHSGLLIWTSSHNDSADRGILGAVAGMIGLGETCTKNIYLVDGARINFILNAIAHVQRDKGASYSFFYPDTGLVNKSDERHGRILPLELVVADMLPLKVVSANEERLHLYVNQSFDPVGFTRVIALALQFTGAWCKEIRIGFPDYNVAQHAGDAAAAKLPFQERDKKISPFCFIQSSLNALENA